MTGLKDNCSLLSTINIILASKLSVEVPCDFRKVNNSKVLPNSSLQTYLTFFNSKHVFPNLCNIRQFIHQKKRKKVERKRRVFFFFERKLKETLKMADWNKSNNLQINKRTIYRSNDISFIVGFIVFPLNVTTA